MKSVILYISLICLITTFYTCKKKDDKRGYKCENSQCKLVDEGADYLTLDDCKSEYAAPAASNGRIEFKSNFTIYNLTDYTIAVGVAKSADDYSKGALLDKKVDSGSFTASGPDNQSKNVQFQYQTVELAPASYYYVVTVVIDDPNNNTPTIKQNSGLVNVSGGQVASVVYNP